MRKVITIFLICTFFLIGCKSKNVEIIYKGTSPNWDVSYKIQGNEEAHESYYTFKYTGVDNDTVKNVEYKIDGPKEGENGKFTYKNSEEYTDKIKITGGIPSNSDRDIKVKVQWDGKSEILTLKRAS